jgi:hypothetical protein
LVAGADFNYPIQSFEVIGEVPPEIDFPALDAGTRTFKLAVRVDSSSASPRKL